MVYAEEDSPVMTPDGKKDTNSKCGIVEVPLIIGGTEALEREFPHMASIGFADGSGIYLYISLIQLFRVVEKNQMHLIIDNV